MHALAAFLGSSAALLALLSIGVRSTDADSRIPLDPLASGAIPKDAHEGDTIVLECHFDPNIVGRLSPGDKLISYWHRTNHLSKTEPAAIGDSPLDPSYRVDYSLEAGRYDLRIAQAKYDRDNGAFQCKIVVSGTGADVKTANYVVTILNPPDPPIITPSQAVAKEGEPFRLECSSKGGSPDPTIQWYRDDHQGPTPLEGEVVLGGTRTLATRNTLTLTNPTVENDGSSYRCVVFNRAFAEEKLEASVKLTVHYKPRITVGPYNPLAVTVDGNAEMSCSVQANPPARSVRWTKGGSIVATSANHTILRVKPEDSGAYDCTAENAVGRTSGALQLSVLHGPIVSIDRVPTATSGKGEAKAGDHVTLRCSVSSNPPAHRIVWSRQGDPSFKAAPGPLLNFAAITAEDIGTYVCSATATLTPSGAPASAGVERTGNASTVLQIQHKPGKTFITPEEPEVVAGRHYTLTCGANPPGYPTPEYEWWREGAELQKLGKRANYTFTALHVSDEGRYFCQPANVHGRGSIGSVYMRVNEPAAVQLPMKPTHEAKEGETNFKLTCIGRGKPRPSVSWTHNGVEINPESGEYRVENREQNEDADVKVLTTTLYFEAMARKGANSLSAADRGTYACHFDNGIEREAKSSTVLRVEHTPVVRHTYNRVAYDIGEVALLQCKVSAYPAPKFEWTFNGNGKGGSGSSSGSNSPLDAEHSDRYGTNSTELPDDLHLGTLSIRNTRESDYGDYTCRATNSAGDDDEKTIIKLVKKSPPETPTSLEVLEVVADSVSLRWAEGFNGGFSSNTEFVVNFHDATHSRNESCRTMNPCKVTGLESRHEYTFRVLAVNPRGFSSYSEPLKVVTRVNLKDMPSAYDSSYDRERNMLSFRVETGDVGLRLIAKIEIRAENQQQQQMVNQNLNLNNQTPSTGNTQWTPLTSVEVLSDLENVYLKSTPEAITDIRVILCLASNESWCGYEHIVKMDSVYRDPRVASTADHLIGVIVTCAIFAAVAFLIIVCCCLKKSRGSGDEKKAKKVGDFESDTSSGGGSGSAGSGSGQQLGKGGLGANFYSSHDNKGLMSDMDAKTLAAAGIYGSTLGSLMNSHSNGVSNYGVSNYTQQQQQFPQNYYLTGDDSEASPNGSNETQTEFWNTMKSGQSGGQMFTDQQQLAMALAVEQQQQQEMSGYGGGAYSTIGAQQMDASGYLNAYNSHYAAHYNPGGYQPLDEETLSRKNLNNMNMYYDEMNGNYGPGTMTYDHQQQQQQQFSGDDVDGYHQNGSTGNGRARVMSEIIV